MSKCTFCGSFEHDNSGVNCLYTLKRQRDKLLEAAHDAIESLLDEDMGVALSLDAAVGTLRAAIRECGE